MPIESVASAAVRQGNEPPKAGVAATATRQLNVQILKASAEVSLSAGDDSLALLFRSAIDRINEMLAPELGENAIENAAGQDWSPEATAQRILDLSTGFFDAYAARHAGKDPEQVARDFVALIRGGFEKGFGEAKEILQGLNVFGGAVESGAMKTHELVHKGYDDFLAGKLAPENKAGSAAQA